MWDGHLPRRVCDDVQCFLCCEITSLLEGIWMADVGIVTVDIILIVLIVVVVVAVIIVETAAACIADD